MQKRGSFIICSCLCLTLLFCGCIEQKAIDTNPEELVVHENERPSVTIQAEPTTGIFPVSVSFFGHGEDPDGTIIEYLWDFDDGTTATTQNVTHTYSIAGIYKSVLVVTDDQGVSALARCTITVTAPPADWELTLIGAETKVINKTQFESYLDQYEEISWTEDDDVWTGLPLWYLVAMVDDIESEGANTLNDELADRGYTIQITAGDGWVTKLKSYDIAHDPGYLIVDKCNGEPLPRYTPKGKPSWPLHLRGDNVVCPNNVGNITTIELLDLPSESDNHDTPIRSLLRDIFQTLFPNWYHFLLDIKDYLTPAS
jgi:hypothetical protein